MVSVTITPGTQITRDDFWISSAALSTGEQFAGLTSSTGGGLLGLGITTNVYDEYRFEAGGYTYRYVGDWTLSINNGLLTDSASAFGNYNQVIIEQNGVQVANLITDSPLSVDFGTANSISLLGLGDLLNPVLDLVIGADADQAFANLHLAITPTLPDIAGIPTDLPSGPGAYIEGTTGDDTLVGTVAGDQILGLEGSDTITGGAGDDVLFGNQGNDTINGEDGNDTIYGGQNDDFINGGAGDDVLVAGTGTDTVYGNFGNDIIYGGNGTADPADGPDTIYGGQGSDTIFGNGGGDIIYGGDGIGDLTDAGDLIYGGRGGDNISGNAGDDEIYGQLESDTLYGNQGNDYLHGGQEDDFIHGGSGSDTINGGLGNDVLAGGLGDDLFVFDTGQNADVVTDFSFAQGDRLDLRGQTFTAIETSDATVLALSGGGTVTLLGVTGDEFQDGLTA